MKGKCLLCGQTLDSQSLLMSFSNMPSSAQNLPDLNGIKDDFSIQLDLYQCRSCGLVQFDCEPVDYYKKVIRAGGETSTMINLRLHQYDNFVKKFNLSGKKVLEVGCGRGEFLKVWRNFPDIHAVGLEDSEELVNAANNGGLTVYQGFIGSARTLVKNAPYDAFVQFNFLEHQPYPNQMLQGIYNNLTDNGVGLVTVPSLEYILQYDGYYELIRDHIAYYSKETLSLLFENNGFEIIDFHTVNRDTHAVYVKKRKKINIQNWMNNFDIIKKEVYSFVDSFISKGEKVAIWGASHQGFTLVSTLELSGKISYIIDSAKFKQGRYAPASHVPIVSPDYYLIEAVTAIIIVAPGYTDEIFEIITKRFKPNVIVATLRSNHLEILNK